MKKLLASAILLAASLAQAAPNLLTNGSFESGLTSWTATSTPATYQPVAIMYGPGAAFNETVLADNATSQSPDLVGARAAYFVDDSAVQSLRQTFNVVTPGAYSVGISLYAPANGHRNPDNALFSVKVDSSSLISTSVSTMTPQVWTPVSNVLNLGVGSHVFDITFSTAGGVSKDLIADRAYVTMSAVPEFNTAGLMLIGLALMGGITRLGRRRG